MEFFQQQRAFVTRHVGQCQTMLIEHVLSTDEGLLRKVDIVNLYDDSIEAIEDFLSKHVAGDDWHELPSEERKRLAKLHDFDPEEREIYEWWLVTSHMAELLAQFGQPVLRSDCGPWWGRTCTGQAIYLDHVITQCVEA